MKWNEPDSRFGLFEGFDRFDEQFLGMNLRFLRASLRFWFKGLRGSASGSLSFSIFRSIHIIYCLVMFTGL